MTAVIKRNTIKTNIIKIGNSQGIRIPKLLLDQLNLGSEVEIEARDDHLVIRPARVPRQGWAEQFAEMAKLGEDTIPDWEDVVTTDWDQEEWEW
jgi:antitoxin MazE